MPNIAGIDCGLTLIKPTSGVCRTGTDGFVVDHTYIDKLSRVQLLENVQHFDCLGIDAPVLPNNILNYDFRAVESLFMRGAFHDRCKPGASHVIGTGQALRRSGCDTAIQFAAETYVQGQVHYPRIKANQNIIEAFPNAFLGVMLDSQVIDETNAGRGEKFDILFSLCNHHGLFEALNDCLIWEDGNFWNAFPITIDHDDRAALVCAATAICAHQGIYVAVGDAIGGYFFLPPWPLWNNWAKDALNVERRGRDFRRRFPNLMVWINGVTYNAEQPLPE